ncbi:MAG: ComF family protein [Clostridia bacterium]|nr:ComF family protein [Clostridia bacterium]
MNLFNIMLSAIYPNRCVVCGEIIPEGESLCEFCSEFIEVCDTSKLCIKCGSMKKNCYCNKRSFYYDGLVAPFLNEENARKVVYSFKLNRKERYCRFLAERMAVTIKQCYDVDFDYVTYVPMKISTVFSRGFNQSYLLAKELSKNLGIPLGYKFLKCVKSNKPQHELSGKERFDNVKGLYSAPDLPAGVKILLVDDIKTTGATLNECAKELYKAGASSVYCVAALLSEKKKGK